MARIDGDENTTGVEGEKVDDLQLCATSAAHCVHQHHDGCDTAAHHPHNHPPLVGNITHPFTAETHRFLPDYTEHPKPKRRPRKQKTGGGADQAPPPPPSVEGPPEEMEDEITFFHDFVAGGVAGCASVIVGHPFDT